MNNQRACTICKIIKPFSEFYLDTRFNIPFSRCKNCYNEKCRKYRSSETGKKTYRNWVTTNGKIVRHNAITKWRSLNANKRSAHTAVSNALRDGKLFKQPCKYCNNPIVEAHHESYEKEHWLNVIWLCKKHHVDVTYFDNSDCKLTLITHLDDLSLRSK